MENLIDEVLEKYNFDNYPTLYKDTLVMIVSEAKDVFKDNLVNITLGGSGGKNLIHEGWSDLDVYFVFKEYNVEQLQEFISKNTSHIHIGTTYYTLSEVQNGMLDNKTKIMLYEKYTYNLNPTLFGDDVFPRISYDIVEENDINNLPNILHEIRRIYLNIKSKKIKLDFKHVKKLLVLLKCILTYNDKFSFGYENVFKEFYKLDNDIFKQDESSIVKMIKNIDDSEELFLDVCDDVFNYLNKIWKES